MSRTSHISCQIQSSDLSELLDFLLKLGSPEIFSKKLWKVFRFAALGGLEDDKTISAEDVASLFDQLITITTAVHALRHRSGAPCTAGEERGHV